MTNAEKKHIEEMNRIREAINKTNSKALKYQYTKHLHRLKKELKEYRYHYYLGK